MSAWDWHFDPVMTAMVVDFHSLSVIYMVNSQVDIVSLAPSKILLFTVSYTVFRYFISKF